MVIWVKAEAAGMPVDQKAEVKGWERSEIIACLLGTRKMISIKPTDICGVEIFSLDFDGVGLSIKFKVTETRTLS